MRFVMFADDVDVMQCGMTVRESVVLRDVKGTVGGREVEVVR